MYGAALLAVLVSVFAFVNVVFASDCLVDADEVRYMAIVKAAMDSDCPGFPRPGAHYRSQSLNIQPGWLRSNNDQCRSEAMKIWSDVWLIETVKPDFCQRAMIARGPSISDGRTFTKRIRDYETKK